MAPLGHGDQRAGIRFIERSLHSGLVGRNLLHDRRQSVIERLQTLGHGKGGVGLQAAVRQQAGTSPLLGDDTVAGDPAARVDPEDDHGGPFGKPKRGLAGEGKEWVGQLM